MLVPARKRALNVGDTVRICNTVGIAARSGGYDAVVTHIWPFGSCFIEVRVPSRGLYSVHIGMVYIHDSVIDQLGRIPLDEPSRWRRMWSWLVG